MPLSKLSQGIIYVGILATSLHSQFLGYENTCIFIPNSDTNEYTSKYSETTKVLGFPPVWMIGTLIFIYSLWFFFHVFLRLKKKRLK